MVKKVFRFCFFAGLVLSISGLTGYYVVRAVFTYQTAEKAKQLINQAYDQYKPETEEEKIVAIAREVYGRFEHVNPSEIPLYKLRPVITNRRLPGFISFPDGALETYIEKGLCDNASRMLGYVLEQENIQSVQWNMVVNQNGHSARLVKLSTGRDILIDPFYGYVAENQGRLLHPQQAKDLVIKGKKPEEIFVSFDNNKEAGFYKNIDTMRMSAQGEGLVIQADIPSTKNGPVFLGDLDGHETDVKKAASKYKMTPYWYYMGHKYNREWVRILRAKEAVKVIFTLVRPVEKNILTASPEPLVDGKKLIWDLKAGQTITLKDGLAKVSLKRLNSYINIDQVAFLPIEN